MLTVYHGSTYRVEQPLAGVCRPNLDFGVGFYLTDLKEQAVRWALRTADIRHENSVWLNIYSLDIDACRNSSFNYLHFTTYDAHWLDFVVACRQAEQRQFVEPVDNVFNICQCQYFDLGANSLQNNLSLA